MMKNACLFLFLLASQCIAFSQANIDLDMETLEPRVDRLINSYIDLGIFSGVVLIAEGGDILYEKAFGQANRVSGALNDTRTKFVIGSMNKSFTRVLILQLIDEGILDFNDRLVDILPGFQQVHAEEITIEQLLNHTSGFGDYFTPEYMELPQEKKNIQGLLPLIRKLPLHFRPGTSDTYSNAGYIILGAIIEKLTGQSYADNVEERITGPLGLEDIVVRNVRTIPDRAIGYLKTLDGYEDNEMFISEPRSDGGFYSTAEEIMHFYREYFYGHSLLSSDIKERDQFFQMIDPIYKESGAGIPLAGGFNGANTVHLEMLADDISIVVFANMDEPVAEKIAIGILHLIKGKAPEEARLPARLMVYEAYNEHGADYVAENFDDLTTNWHPMDPKDYILNNLGYDLMHEGKLEQALELFKLNTELFPEIGNCWDSYGEALRNKGDRKGALAAYKKALEINPEIPTARKAVEELSVEKD